MFHTGKITTDIQGKCGKCSYYSPLVKARYNIKTEFCHGTCTLKDTYQQRTDTCKKFKEGD